MTKRRGLGRGLDALLSSSAAAVALGEGSTEEFQTLPLDLVRRSPFQPRREMDPAALEELTQSVRSQGVVQPILVRPCEGGTHFELIAGERRWRAAQAAELSDIPAVVRQLSDEAALAIALVENIQRENLNPMDEAEALRRLIQHCAMTHESAAEAVGRSRVAVTNLLRLLDLNEDVQALVRNRALEMGHARALVALPCELQSVVARQAAAKGLSVRETERLVRRYKRGRARVEQPQRSLDPDVRRLQENLAERLGAQVQLLHRSSSGKGQVVIRYDSLEQLDGILERLRGDSPPL
jgi:ParB family chromosome partitioning protein